MVMHGVKSKIVLSQKKKKKKNKGGPSHATVSLFYFLPNDGVVIDILKRTSNTFEEQFIFYVMEESA